MSNTTEALRLLTNLVSEITKADELQDKLGKAEAALATANSSIYMLGAFVITALIQPENWDIVPRHDDIDDCLVNGDVSNAIEILRASLPVSQNALSCIADGRWRYLREKGELCRLYSTSAA